MPELPRLHTRAGTATPRRHRPHAATATVQNGRNAPGLPGDATPPRLLRLLPDMVDAFTEVGSTAATRSACR
jgi:hypothetical protein